MAMDLTILDLSWALVSSSVSINIFFEKLHKR